MVVQLLAGGATVPDHGALLGLSDDDHLQYALLAGRAGGQLLYGGPNAGNILSLQGANSLDVGVVRSFSPFQVELGQLTGGGFTAAFNWVTSYTAGSAGVANTGINIAPAIGVTFNNFVFSALTCGAVLSQQVVPLFSAFTLFNAQSVNQTASTTFAPLSAIVYQDFHTTRVSGAGGAPPATASHIGFRFLPRQEAIASGDVCRVVANTGLACEPTWNTAHAAATVDFGTIRAVRCSNPVQFVFGASLGTEIMDAYYGLDWDNITFGGSAEVAAVRSAQADGTNKYCLLHTGTAESRHGGILRMRGGSGFAVITYGASNEVSLGYNTTNAALQMDGRLRFQSGHLASDFNSPASIGANQNNYALPSGASQKLIHRLTASGAFNITGIAVQLTRDIVILTNIGTNVITLTHEDGASTATNRFVLPGAANLALGQNHSVIIWHDTTTDRWRVLSRSN